ncbi:MAG: DUF1552 domain-containing protein [Phycisphaera sp.]|nr:DUF1552 domain-containing protein [Phycisphaera sp.]
MSSERWRISRRTLLRGIGATMALPMLDVMGGKAMAAEAAKAPLRTAFMYIPNGVIGPDWMPDISKVGADYTLPKSLKALEPVRKKMLVMTGLCHDKAKANGDGAGDHARCAGTFLTGVQVRKTDGKDIHAGTSVDQVMAQKIGMKTPLSSLELGAEGGRQAGNCDSGYSCAYSSNISWRSPTTPNAKEINPRAVFERLFGDSKAVESKREAAKRELYRRSVLDVVLSDAKDLRGKVSNHDQRKLDEYLDSVREIEKRIQAEEGNARAKLPPDLDVPEGVPTEYAEHLHLMMDLMVVAFQTDMTRVTTFMYSNAGSNRSYPFIGVREGHHSLSHHRGDAEKMAQLQKIDEFHIEQFAYMLQKMDSIKEGDGTLLDHSMIMYGSAIGDGNRHNHDDLPAILAGGGNGTLTPGRHVHYEAETPMANLFLSMLDRMDASVDQFGDSTGRLDQLKV